LIELIEQYGADMRLPELRYIRSAIFRMPGQPRSVCSTTSFTRS
jgi:hypothetical protein